jgi:L-lactate dehydrogenase (cytochrome)
LGLDGIIVSNHGGRQLDAGQSSIKTLGPIVKKYQGKIKIMLDSGLRTGPDIARTLASGAEFTFLGRSFMYAVAEIS